MSLVGSAGDAETALRMAAAQQPHVIVLDLDLGGRVRPISRPS